MAKIFEGRVTNRHEILEFQANRPDPIGVEFDRVSKFLEDTPTDWLLFEIYWSDMEPLSGESWRGYRAINPTTGYVKEYTLAYMRA